MTIEKPPNEINQAPLPPERSGQRRWSRLTQLSVVARKTELGGDGAGFATKRL